MKIWLYKNIDDIFVLFITLLIFGVAGIGIYTLGFHIFIVLLGIVIIGGVGGALLLSICYLAIGSLLDNLGVIDKINSFGQGRMVKEMQKKALKESAQAGNYSIE